MQKWSYFSMGIMAGIIAVLLTVVILQNREPMAHAAPQSADAGSGGLIMGTGGAQTQTNDVVWVLYKRPAPRKPGADPKDIIASRTEMLTLAGYQVANGARGMKLVAVRDISFDMEMVEYKNDKPEVMEIVTELKRQKAKEK